jgi:succinate dehydrogenase / fumarate reductase flavoprotein subunit
VREGRGINGEDYVHLDLSHLPPELIDQKLPDITDFARTYLGVEPKTEPIPIQPTAHYAMGGLADDVEGRVIRDEAATGRSRGCTRGRDGLRLGPRGQPLGTNSLVDLVVFGRRAGRHMLGSVADADLPPLPPDPEFTARAQVADLKSRTKGGAGRRSAGRRLPRDG